MERLIALLPLGVAIILFLIGALLALAAASRCMTAGVTGRFRSRPKSRTAPFAGVLVGIVLIFAYYLPRLAWTALTSFAGHVIKLHRPEDTENTATTVAPVRFGKHIPHPRA